MSDELDYCEMKNVKDTAYGDGKVHGKIEGIIEAKRSIAKTLKNKKFEIDFIIEVTGLTKQDIEKL